MPSSLGSVDSGTVLSQDDEGEEEEYLESDPCEDEEGGRVIIWTGYGKRTPILSFKIDALNAKNANEFNEVGERYHMAFKIVRTESRLIRNVLGAHGFHEVHPNSNDFNLMWTGGHIKPFMLKTFHDFQKVNHFPRSYEVTRKDRLYKNIVRMQQLKGHRNFDFVPSSFIVPNEYNDFCNAFLKEKGLWIVKPVASSRGRGIFVINHPDQVPLDETTIVSRYINNPLLVDGFKFDLRLYVAVTCYDPLMIYLYEEGLARFATVPYEKNARNIRNQCMHLTNYSVNKRNANFVQNEDSDVEDYGNKWSLGALLRHLKSEGKDVVGLMMRIEDVLIKTIIAGEMQIASACKMFVPHRTNCFEVYGFDILIDDNLKPWLLEVNLSPSLACDSPIDMKIKSNLVTDLFSLVGFVLHDPMTRRSQQSWRNTDYASNSSSRTKKRRPGSAGLTGSNSNHALVRSGSLSRVSSAGVDKVNRNMSGLTGEEIKIVRRAREEYQRKAGYIRIFPTEDTWDLYANFLQYSSSHNQMLHERLFSGRKDIGQRSTLEMKIKVLHLYPNIDIANSANEAGLSSALRRSIRYERPLSSADKKRRKRYRSASCGAFPIGKQAASIVQGVPTDNSSRNNNASQNEGGAPQAPLRSMPDIAQHCDSQSDSSDSPPQAEKERPSRSRVRSALAQGKESSSAIVFSDHHNSSHPQQQRLPEPPSLPPPPPRPRVCSPPPAVIPEPRPPTPPKKKPQIDLVNELKRGVTLSQVQARTAFAAYLRRVRERLTAETTSRATDDNSNEQMELVLRFLKRAASNLQQPFKVAVPSRRLAVHDRKRMLAKQLGDFVHIYCKETEGLQNRLFRLYGLSGSSGGSTAAVTAPGPGGDAVRLDRINEEHFEEFVDLASEMELEDVLTTYTRMQKSASIFLTSKPIDPRSLITQTTNTETSADTEIPPEDKMNSANTEIQASAQNISVSNDLSVPPSHLSNRSRRNSNTGSMDDIHAASSAAAKPRSRPSSARSMGNLRSVSSQLQSSQTNFASQPYRQTPHLSVGRDRDYKYWMSASQYSYRNAVSVYSSQQAIVPQFRPRPMSASSYGAVGYHSSSGYFGSRSRPFSAVSRTSAFSGPMKAGYNLSSTGSFTEEALSSAMQKLNLRQQHRVYSQAASNGAFSQLARSHRPRVRSFTGPSDFHMKTAANQAAKTAGTVPTSESQPDTNVSANNNTTTTISSTKPPPGDSRAHIHQAMIAQAHSRLVPRPPAPPPSGYTSAAQRARVSRTHTIATTPPSREEIQPSRPVFQSGANIGW